MPVNEKERGQVLVLATAFLFLGTTMLMGLFQLSMVVREKINLQLSADMAVLSALNAQANGLNALALGNRAVLANGSLAAQLNALVSETAFYKELIERFRRFLKFVPTVGPVFSQALAAGGNAIHSFARGMAGSLIPAGQVVNRLLETEARLLVHTLPARSLIAARKVTEDNAPDAEIWLPTRLSLLRQARSLARSLSALDGGETRRLLRESMGSRALRRNWRPGIGGISAPVRKTGGTRILAADLGAYDNLQIKARRRLRWRWRTVLAARSKASRFGYRSHGRLLGMSPSGPVFSLTLILKSGVPDLKDDPDGSLPLITAVSAGEVFYRRPGRQEEGPNAMNPFWGARLFPVASDPLAGKVLPAVVLREIRH